MDQLGHTRTTTVIVETVGRATVQDLGRPGLGGLGIAVNGASDQRSARTANILVGNEEAAPLIEITGSALRFSVVEPALMSVTGAADSVTVNGHVAPTYSPVAVPARGRVSIAAPGRGLRSYLAFNGRIDAEVVLGSVAPDTLLGVGTVLTSGTVLTVDSRYTDLTHPYLYHPVFRLGVAPLNLTGRLRVSVTSGPDRDQFAADAFAATYEISPQSDHVGLRANGPTPPRFSREEILSRGVPVGAIEVPPSGGLLVLLRGRIVTAGYPVVAVATSAAVDDLGQLRPGDEIVLSECSTEEAVAAARSRRAALDRLRARVAAAFNACGLGTILAPSERG